MGNNKNHKRSMSSYSLKRKLVISFALMSILPVLVSMYLVSNHILPKMGLQLEVVAAIFVSIVIAVAGFFVIKQIFDRIVSVSTEAKLIAAGDITRRLDVEHPDEVGDLGDALNQLTQRIRTNMDELKNYSEKTTEINLEIQKRVMVLSSLLQISSLISQGAKLEDILKLTVEKARLLANSDVAYLLFREEAQEIFSMKIAEGINSTYLMKVTVGPKDDLFGKAIKTNKPLVLDKENILPEEAAFNFYERFRLKNTLALPIYLRGKVAAILGIGNAREHFLYHKEDLELLDIFAKQVAIAVENDVLMHKVEKLEIKDALTGLYNAAFIRSRLQEEIKRAITYQRPCALILIDLDNFKKYQEGFGLLLAEGILKRIGILIKDSVSDIDRVARFGDDEFAVVLPEKNKRQAQEIAEDIRKKVEFSFGEEPDPKKKVTVSAGVSENPLDGVDAEELVNKARELVDVAKRQGRNRVVGFKEPTTCP